MFLFLSSVCNICCGRRHFGPKTKLEIIKDTGHALNIDSPARLYELIESFSLGCSNSKDDI